MSQQVVKFSSLELTKLMLEKANINEGLWAMRWGFNLQTAGIMSPDGPLPAAVVVIAEMGLERVTEPGPTVVDAATRELAQVPVH